MRLVNAQAILKDLKERNTKDGVTYEMVEVDDEVVIRAYLAMDFDINQIHNTAGDLITTQVNVIIDDVEIEVEPFSESNRIADDISNHSNRLLMQVVKLEQMDVE
jgi:hypothetical protein